LLHKVEHLLRIGPSANRVGNQAKGGVFAGEVRGVGDVAVEDAGGDGVLRFLMFDNRADRQQFELDAPTGGFGQVFCPTLLQQEVRVAGGVA
jgi:hypothetical protein